MGCHRFGIGWVRDVAGSDVAHIRESYQTRA